jgi:hypothetical protein
VGNLPLFKTFVNIQEMWRAKKGEEKIKSEQGTHSQSSKEFSKFKSF